MFYIIPITIFSVVILLFTTHTTGARKNKKNGSEKQPFFDGQSVKEIIQQLVIVFLSAMLAMWLTEYVENKSVKERVQTFFSSMQDICFSELATIDDRIKKIYEIEDLEQRGTNEQLYGIAKEIMNEKGTVFETVVSNESVISTLAPMSYLYLHDDLEMRNRIKSNLEEINKDDMDRQMVAEQIAEYLFYSTDAAFSLDYLKEDVTYDLLMLIMLDDAVFDEHIFYLIYNEDIRMLEEIFSVDLSAWKGRRRNN